MAERLAATHDLTVWNRTPARAEPFEELGARVVDSATALADHVDVVLTCIDTPQGLDEVLFGARGMAAAAHPPRLVVDHSTMHPGITRSQAERLRGFGVHMVDAPVSGGPHGARAGTLTVFAGGDLADFDLVRPVLAAYAGNVNHLGPLGSGQVGKLCNQIVNFATMAAIAEATAVGSASGLDEGALLAAMAGGLADSTMLREYARGRANEETTSITGIIGELRHLLLGIASEAPRGGRVDILLKDLDAALDVARSVGTATPVGGVLDGVYRILLHRGPGLAGQPVPAASPADDISSRNRTT